ncbi:MAG: hypothetical protein FWE48_01545 [Coriobacteriia bacterium]|nr:hypothetical protein [Coriobacteriia bacterium]MCL2745764.1 hypothetical protein [Coriobacteriia bacterium]MCL2870219.1 hypothetical protein [Coriobacteriia bacterium]
MSADTKKKAMQEHEDAQQKKKRKKFIVAVLSFASIVVLMLAAFWLFSGWVGDFLGVDEDNRPSITEIVDELYQDEVSSGDDLSASEAAYQAIYDEYAQRMREDHPDLSQHSFSLLAEEGVVQMSHHFETTSQSDAEESLYQDWARKLLFLYEEMTGQMEHP